MSWINLWKKRWLLDRLMSAERRMWRVLRRGRFAGCRLVRDSSSTHHDFLPRSRWSNCAIEIIALESWLMQVVKSTPQFPLEESSQPLAESNLLMDMVMLLCSSKYLQSHPRKDGPKSEYQLQVAGESMSRHSAAPCPGSSHCTMIIMVAEKCHAQLAL